MLTDVRALALEYESLCIKFRRDLHEIPELELNLPETSKYLQKVLQEYGIEYQLLLAGNAVVAQVKGRTASDRQAEKCLAIRADMDGLPINEETGLPFASKHPGLMHACGHDTHMAVALTTAVILQKHPELFHGTVKFLFQPGEEIPGGALPMIKEGALANPRPQAVIGLHGGNLLEGVPNGKIAFKSGALMAAMDKFTLTIIGKSGHGANPDRSIDPIVIAAEVILALQKIVSREIPPVERAVVSVCKIVGGFTQNIIPDKVVLTGTSRSLKAEVQDLIERRIGEIAQGIAQTYGGQAELKYERYYPILKNDPKFTQRIEELARELFPDKVITLEKPTMGGDDMAYFLDEIPGTYFFLLNSLTDAQGHYYSNHSSHFDVSESSLTSAVAIYLAAVCDFLH